MIPLISFPFLYNCDIIQKHFTSSSTSGQEDLLIDLSNNRTSRVLVCPNKSKIYIGQQCKKYHFQCYIEAKVNNKKRHIENIKLNRIHFLKQIKDTYFTISSHYNVGITSTIITTNTQSREIVLPIIDFDFAKKKLEKKLNTIELLG